MARSSLSQASLLTSQLSDLVFKVTSNFLDYSAHLRTEMSFVRMKGYGNLSETQVRKLRRYNLSVLALYYTNNAEPLVLLIS